jgi:hypothetical protein
MGLLGMEGESGDPVSPIADDGPFSSPGSLPRMTFAEAFARGMVEAAFVTAPDESVFFAGRTGDVFASNAAKASGKITIAKLLERNNIADPVNYEEWTAASLAMARGASGKVTVYYGEFQFANNVFDAAEHQALMNNLRVTEITGLDPYTGEIIWRQVFETMKIEYG